MTEKEYRKHPAISRSELWKLNESPEKFKWYKDHPEKPTPALLFGQVVHKLLLEPDGFETEFAVLPEVDRRTKSGKDEYNAFLEENNGKGIVTLEMFQTAWEMAEKAKQEPFVAKLLKGEHEKPYFWTDEVTGENCKCRVDCLTDIGGKPYIIDYKTCSDASNDSFMRDAIKYGYHVQSAMYSDGVEHNIGTKPTFVFIAQEKTAPYALNIFQADEAFVQYGMDVYRELMGVYHYCRTTGNFYGYLGRQQIINELQLPTWMAKND